MDQTSIFGPLFAMMLLTLAVWLYMYSRRIPFIQRNKLTPDQLTPSELEKRSPPSVANSSHNLKNLFELPLLFYTMSIYLFVVQQVDNVHIIAAWIFVGFRILHSLMHCTLNIPLARFALYVVSSIGLWCMVGRALFQFWFW